MDGTGGRWELPEEVADEVAVVARGLTVIGLRPGGRVLIMLAGRPEYRLIDVAVVHVGATPVPVRPTVGIEALHRLARHSAAQLLVLAGPADLARWRPILPDLPGLRRVVLVDDPAPDELSLATVSLAQVRTAGTLARRADPGRRRSPV